MKSYTTFADFYDSLTENVGYKERADYICEILAGLNHNTGLSLDLACGTGSLTVELKKNGLDIYGIDASAQMLSQAQQKAYEQEQSILFLCQKMQKLDLYGSINTCICTLDSINHLTSPEDVLKTFEKVSLFMEKDGIFLFDVNTVYKHQRILANNNFVFETDDVFCVWQNTLNENNIVQIDLDFFEKNENCYYRTSESFCERAYSHEELVEMLEKCDFELLAVYGDMSFEKPKEDEERAIYVARKICNSCNK